MNWLLLAGRLGLGLTFCAAGAAKVGDPQAFAAQLAAYHLLPERWLTLVALALPEVELLAGACLSAGFLAESSALVLGTLSLAFVGALGSALARGLDIECGCFSGAAHVSLGQVGLDLILLVLALAVLRWGPGAVALDGWLERKRAGD